MLAAYERLLTNGAHADVREALDTVFRPVGEWIGGQYVITTPALLVVQSILYSHCEWFHEHLWEASSAVRAYRELRGATSEQRAIVSEAHARFIAAIIAHQTLLRAAWSTGEDDPREVYAFYDMEGGRRWADLQFEDQSQSREWIDQTVGLALASTLFSFLLKHDDESREAPVDKRQPLRGSSCTRYVFRAAISGASTGISASSKSRHSPLLTASSRPGCASHHTWRTCSMDVMFTPRR